MMPAGDRWGPFADGLEPGERLARLRSLRAIVRLLCGPRGERLQAALRDAESDEVALPAALAEIGALGPVDFRRVLGSYAGLTRLGEHVTSAGPEHTNRTARHHPPRT